MPHIHEKIDFVAEAYIVHNNKVLLRKHDKYNIWLPVGGHIELDEDPNQAAIREAKEECGLEIILFRESFKEITESNGSFNELIPPMFMNIHKINDVHKHIALVYFATCSSTELNPTGEDISTEMKWFSKEDLEDPTYKLKEYVKHYALSALKKLS